MPHTRLLNVQFVYFIFRSALLWHFWWLALLARYARRRLRLWALSGLHHRLWSDTWVPLADLLTCLFECHKGNIRRPVYAVADFQAANQIYKWIYCSNKRNSQMSGTSLERKRKYGHSRHSKQGCVPRASNRRTHAWISRKPKTTHFHLAC